ncbi:Oidioi.mRNA.OKI2018_I69.chr1.g1000.t1.cds [Oikopleura dioica]|uniref:Oidioi.mRNA.OKI2018_I69.chr1.g1000.t1.cds n=1 Tax=Oikopleura dioica TaxID=34765 RepID=A0ABN7SNC2_OIKDI|nr:Oidioi.mRNA.OKI2018_I69.chr1.g1000.t1.cds [Oikopleura dioica]
MSYYYGYPYDGGYTIYTQGPPPPPQGFPVPPPYYPHQPYPMSQFVPTPTDSTSEANSECSSSSNGGLLCTKKLTESVRKLCEATFSNAGLSREPYLVKQIARTTAGYISIKLIASLKKIRKITRSLQILINALRESEIFEVSECSTKVRRKEPLPETLKAKRSITSVLAINVAEEDAEIERLSSLFKEFGRIQQMRIVPPDRKLPVYLHGYATQVPELGKEICAIVEFENEESAKNAVAGFSENDLSQMRVALLGPKLRRNLYHVNHDRRSGTSSCQSSIISSLDTSLEECHITDTIGTDTDSGIFSPRSKAANQEQSTSSKNLTPSKKVETEENSED